MNAPQRSAWAALQRLDPKARGFAASSEVRDALQSLHLRVYLETWVLPHLRYAAGMGEQYGREREDLRRDVGNVQARARESEAGAAS
jgi:hypothetical protein